MCAGDPVEGEQGEIVGRRLQVALISVSKRSDIIMSIKL